MRIQESSSAFSFTGAAGHVQRFSPGHEALFLDIDLVAAGRQGIAVDGVLPYEPAINFDIRDWSGRGIDGREIACARCNRSDALVPDPPVEAAGP